MIIQLHVGLHCGVLCAELMQHRLQHRKKSGTRSCDAQGAGNLITRAAHALYGLLQRDQPGLRRLEELLSLIGERHVARGAMK
ncbi:hypothetical protein D3C86_1971820 [compost metagenome]